MSDLQTFWYLMVFQIVLVLVFSTFAIASADINCPTIDSFQDPNNPYSGNQSLNIDTVWSGLGLITSGCSGIPWYAWIVVFFPGIIAMIVYVLPGWLAGG